MNNNNNNAMRIKIEKMWCVIINTIMTLGLITVDAAMIAWACWEEELITTLFAVASVLITLAIAMRTWLKTIRSL